jgi:hypothetical protein
MSPFFSAVHPGNAMSGYGPERTFQPHRAMSAFGSNADSISSLRAFPLMTDAVEKVSRSDRRIVIPSA